MGRGQTAFARSLAPSKIKDHFSAIFGERRGHTCSEEPEPVPAVPEIPTSKPFSHQRKMAQRRMGLARHLLSEWPTPDGGTVAAINRGFTFAYWPEDPILRSDLVSLVRQGICQRRGGPKPTQGNLLHYIIEPLSAWPAAHQEAYREWEAAGGIVPPR